MNTPFLSPGDIINGEFTLESKGYVFSIGRVSFLLYISISSSLQFPLPNKCSLSQGGRLVTCSDKLFHLFKTQPLFFTPYANENTSLMIRKRWNPYLPRTENFCVHRFTGQPHTELPIQLLEQSALFNQQIIVPMTTSTAKLFGCLRLVSTDYFAYSQFILERSLLPNDSKKKKKREKKKRKKWLLCCWSISQFF